MDLGVAGKVALVAGAGSGLGRATARRLAAEGAHVAICGRDPGRLADAEREITAAGTGKVWSKALDLTVDGAPEDWVESVVREAGELHIVVTNAAGPPPGPVDSFTPADYRAAVDAAFIPHVALVLAALPHLRAAGWGRILIIASETVRQPIPRYGLSNAARPGLVGFAKSLVQALGAGDITVNVLAPGYHRTPALERQFGDRADAAIAEIAKDIPLGRVGTPEDFAAVAAFLASAHAGFVTGTVQLVDGGANRGIP